MRFLEEWFGISPDNGDGSAEIFVLMLVVVLAALIGMSLPLGPKRKTDV